MERFSAEGIVLKAGVTGESDRIIYVLTAARGVIRAFAKGARGTKSKLHAGTAQFAHCDFVFSEKNGVYNVYEASQKTLFYELSLDLKKLTLAQYFCEVLLREVPEASPEPEYLRLLLNSLYVMCKDKKPVQAVKAVFELRMTAISGYSPALVACDTCGTFETNLMYFDTFTGKLYCENCGTLTGAIRLPLSVISAMRHIVFSSPEKIFSFEMSQDGYHLLSGVTERYLKHCFQHSFRLLDFYYSV